MTSMPLSVNVVNIKAIILRIIGLALFLSVLATTSIADTLKIGVMLPPNGHPERDAISLAIDEQGSQVSGHRIMQITKIRKPSDDCNKMAEEAKNLVRKERVHVLLGAGNDACTTAIGEIAKANKLLYISPISVAIIQPTFRG